jgi:hypothetical protein
MKRKLVKRKLVAAAVFAVALAVALLVTHLRNGKSGPVNVDADLRIFAETIRNRSETLTKYGGDVRAELRGCILTWSTVTRNDCASNNNLISETYSVDLSQMRWLRGERDPLILTAITANIDPREVYVRPLPALPLDALPQATSSLRDQLGETFFSYGTFCTTPPTGARNMLSYFDFPRGEEGRVVREAINRMTAACPVAEDFRTEQTVEPAQ